MQRRETQTLDQPYACPFLGMEDDPQTSFLFVSPGNFCHRLKPPKPVSTGYQGSICFDQHAYVQCPIYKENWKGELPEGFRQRNGTRTGKQSLTPRWAVIILILFLALLGASVFFVLFTI